MRFKKIEIFLMCYLLLIVSLSCNSSDKSETEHFEAKDTLVELDTLLFQLRKIDTADCANMDEIVTVNETMRGIVENIRTIEEFDDLVNAFENGSYQISFVFSEDEKLGLFSWRTKMDCLGNNIKNIALFKYNGKVKASSLYGNPMMFQNIKSKKQNKDKTLYIFEGSSSTDNNLNDLTQKGYKITNGYLAESQIPETEQAYVNKTSL